MLYSHDTLGYGHLRRNLMIARTLKSSALTPEVLMVVGTREAGAFELPAGVDCLSLPAYAKGTDGTYRPRDLGGDLARLTGLRSQLIEATVRAFDPDLMIVDNVPRGALGELDATLRTVAKRGRTRLVLGLRDVIDGPAVVRRQWIRDRNFEAVRLHYSEVWIYGDPTFYDLLREYGFEADLGAKARFTGYLDHSGRLGSPLAALDRDAVLGKDPKPYVLCAVGGGRDGAALCDAFAAAPCPEGHRGVLVTGSQMPETAQARLRALAVERPDLTVVDFVREPIALMAGASRIVCMGGYNTVCEVLSLCRPTLVVPRARPRAEQAIRAERLAERGLLGMMPLESLTPEALGRWMAGANTLCPDPREALDLGGLDRVRWFAESALGHGSCAAVG